MTDNYIGGVLFLMASGTVLSVIYILLKITALISTIQLNDRFGKFLDMYEDVNYNALNPDIEINESEASEHTPANTNLKPEDELTTISNERALPVRKSLIITLSIVLCVWIVGIALFYLSN